MQRDKGRNPDERRKRAEVRLKAWAFNMFNSNPEALQKLNRPLDWPLIEDDTAIDARLAAARIQLQRRALLSDNSEVRDAYALALGVVTQVGALREEAINSVDWEEFYKNLDREEPSLDLDEAYETLLITLNEALKEEAAEEKEYGYLLCLFSGQGFTYFTPSPDLHPEVQIQLYRQLERLLLRMARR